MQKDPETKVHFVAMAMFFGPVICAFFYLLFTGAFTDAFKEYSQEETISEVAKAGTVSEKQINIICAGGKPYIHKDGKYLQLLGWDGRQTRTFASDYLESLCVK